MPLTIAQRLDRLKVRIAEISQQLRTSSEGNLPGPGVPYELSKDEIDFLYEERDRLIKMLDEDAGLAA